MDFYIDIVISENDLDICGITEIMNTWEGKSIRKNPREFTKGSIKLVEIGPKGHGEEIDKKIALCITSGLHDIEVKCNLDKEDLDNSDVFAFIKEIAKLDEYAITIGYYDEKVLEEVEIDKEDVLKHVFIKALNWDKPIGITIKKDRV